MAAFQKEHHVSVKEINDGYTLHNSITILSTVPPVAVLFN